MVEGGNIADGWYIAKEILKGAEEEEEDQEKHMDRPLDSLGANLPLLLPEKREGAARNSGRDMGSVG